MNVGHVGQVANLPTADWQSAPCLANLDRNLKCGNCLIGPGYFTGRLIPDDER